MTEDSAIKLDSNKVNIDYRIAREFEFEEINVFFNRIHQLNRTLDRFCWEFKNSPAGPAVYVIARDVSSKVETAPIVGCQCYIPIYLLSEHGELILTGKSEDTLVDPMYRGMNIFNHMYELLFQVAKENGISAIWGFTSAVKPFKRMGFEVSRPYQRGVYVQKLTRTYTSFSKGRGGIDKSKALVLAIYARFFALYRQILNFGVSIESGYRIERNAKFNRDEFFSVIRHLSTPVLNLSLSDDFYKWRVLDNPYSDYYESIQLLDGQDRIVGDVVFSYREGYGYIEQVLFHSDLSYQNKLYLLKRVIQAINKQGVSFIRFMGFDHNEILDEQKKLLKHLGFIFLPEQANVNSFVWKSLSNRITDYHTILLSKLYTQGN